MLKGIVALQINTDTVVYCANDVRQM